MINKKSYNMYKIILIIFCLFARIINTQSQISYQYDQSNRVNRIDYPNGSFIDFTYDAIGNRLATTITIPTLPKTNIKTFLEGCYIDSQMVNLLHSGGHLPFTQPFSTPPWNYTGTESADTLMPDIVDWILLEIRTGLLANTKVAQRAALLKTDGMIVDLDGISQVSINNIEPGNYYVVIRHRNHLDVMSSNPVAISTGGSSLYDFTIAQTQAYGSNPMKDLGDGKFGMYAGDANADGTVDYNNDVLNNWLPNFGLTGYRSADFRLSGTVEYQEDLLNLWLPNFGFTSQVPAGNLRINPNPKEKNILNESILRHQNEKKAID